MIYLSGAVRPAGEGIGYMLQPGMGNRLPAGASWAADNGCYSQGDRFDADRWLLWLDRFSAEERSRCLFAVAPDVVGDASATLERSRPFLTQIRNRGYRAALVGQDGLESLEVPWAEFDAFFVGGTTEWKLSLMAASLAAEAKVQGKWVHMGRVNSERRTRMASMDGYDSVDGTYAAFRARSGGGDKGMREIAGWISQLTLDLSVGRMGTAA